MFHSGKGEKGGPLTSRKPAIVIGLQKRAQKRRPGSEEESRLSE
jgi:hypothetical protein